MINKTEAMRVLKPGGRCKKGGEEKNGKIFRSFR